MDHETTTCITLVHASTRLYFSRCVVFCFLSNLVPSSTVILPLLASRVLSEVAKWQLLIVEGLFARHLIAYGNLLFIYRQTQQKKWARLENEKWIMKQHGFTRITIVDTSNSIP